MVYLRIREGKRERPASDPWSEKGSARKDAKRLAVPGRQSSMRQWRDGANAVRGELFRKTFKLDMSGRTAKNDPPSRIAEVLRSEASVGNPRLALDATIREAVPTTESGRVQLQQFGDGGGGGARLELSLQH